MIVAIIGRPNVGKSTLFNRLVGRRLALVDDRPGVTRDRREGEAKLGDLAFTIIDTAGLDDATQTSTEERMQQQTEQAMEQADICLFMIDARAGITPLDTHFAEMARRFQRPLILIANKAEGQAGENGFYEAFSLGLGEPVAISAEHDVGMADLYQSLRIIMEQDVEDSSLSAETDFDDDAGRAGKPLRIAVVGRPNAGKSTLINRMIGEERLLAGPEAGLTRDSIAVNWQWKDKHIRLFDTAGMRRRAKVQDKLERLSVADALRAIRFAESVVLLLDATHPFEKQDLQIASLVEREGRALVIALNKWDLIKASKQELREQELRLEELLPQLKGVRLIPLSSLTGKGIDPLMKAVFTTNHIWNERISTARLNGWLDHALERHPPPLASGRRIRIRYMTQIKSRPPTFVAFCSRPDALPEAYNRYLMNGLRETFKLDGVPIRLLMRKGDNPYAGKAKKRR